MNFMLKFYAFIAAMLITFRNGIVVLFFSEFHFECQVTTLTPKPKARKKRKLTLEYDKNKIITTKYIFAIEIRLPCSRHLAVTSQRMVTPGAECRGVALYLSRSNW